MQNTRIYFILLIVVAFLSCERKAPEPSTQIKSDLLQQSLNDNHPNAEKYQEILDRNQKLGIVGTTLMIKDQYGEWIGASGKANLETNTNVVPDDLFLIASISKVFTATAIFKYVDYGKLSIDDPIEKWLDKSLIGKLKNADKCR